MSQREYFRTTIKRRVSLPDATTTTSIFRPSFRGDRFGRTRITRTLPPRCPTKKRKTRKHSFGQHLFTLLRRADRVKSYATSRWGRNCLNSCRRFSTRHHYIQLLEVVGFAFETDTMIVGRFWLSLPTTTRRCATAGASGAALSCHA